MSTSKPPSLKVIARCIEQTAEFMPEACLEHDPPQVWRFGPLTVRCRNDKHSARRLAAKFRRGAKNYVVGHDYDRPRSYRENGDPIRRDSVEAGWFKRKG